MARLEGFSTFSMNEDDIRKIKLDIFNIPEEENTFISGKEV